MKLTKEFRFKLIHSYMFTLSASVALSIFATFFPNNFRVGAFTAALMGTIYFGYKLWR